MSKGKKFNSNAISRVTNAAVACAAMSGIARSISAAVAVAPKKWERNLV